MSVMASVARRRRESIFQINPNRPVKANFIITDIFTNIDEVSKAAFTASSRISSVKLFLTSNHVLNPTIILALILLGLLNSLFSFLMDLIIQKLQFLRIFLLDSSDSQVLSIGLWIFYCIFLAELATFATSWLNQDSQGSGIPEMKAILSGVKLRNFMSPNTLAAKFTGVSLAMGGGLSIGREGPFVHISGILARYISKIPIFRHIHTVTSYSEHHLAQSVPSRIGGRRCGLGVPESHRRGALQHRGDFYLLHREQHVEGGLLLGVECDRHCLASVDRPGGEH